MEYTFIHIYKAYKIVSSLVIRQNKEQEVTLELCTAEGTATTRIQITIEWKRHTCATEQIYKDAERTENSLPRRKRWIS